MGWLQACRAVEQNQGGIEMDARDLETKRLPSNADVYAKSSSFNLRFIALTILFVVDLAAWAIVFFKGLAFLPLPSLVYLFLALLCLCALAKSGFQAHQTILRQMQGGRTDSIEKGAPLNELLRINKDTILNTLLFVFAMAACFLRVLLELVFSR
jgi:hypothetical protein